MTSLAPRCSRCGGRERVRGVYYAGELCATCRVSDVATFDAGVWPRPVWEYSIGSAAVVGRHFGALVLFSRAGIRPVPASVIPGEGTLEALARVVREDGQRQLWIHESALLPLELPLEQPRRRPTEIPAEEQPWRRLEGVELAVPAWEGRTGHDGVYRNRSPWFGVSAIELLWHLAAFEETVGHRWIRTGAITSDAMLSEHWGGKIAPAELPGDWATEPLEQPDHRVDRELLAELASSRPARHLYGFDLNANYLGAASNLNLPTGPPAEAGWGEVAATRKVPGYWETDEGWRTTTGVGELRARRGFVYFAHHQYLQPWYKRLRDARAVLTPGPALRAVKAVYQQGPGRLISSRRGSSPYAVRLFQPYWQQAVVANARERLRRRIAAFHQAPVAVDVDAVFLFSDRQDAGILAAFVGLRLGDGLGEWHAIGRCSGKAARAALELPDDLEALAELRRLVK